jgi:glycosyltransferase involved in cell wall biosynthesis
VTNVAAIIATCNRAYYLGEAIDSVLGQTAPPAQVIVVNDGSTDQTAAVLKRYGERIEVIDQENGGKSRALNRAMPRVRGEYVWIFDDDDIALPDNLEQHLAVLEAYPLVGFVYSGFSMIRVHPNGRVENKGRIKMPDVHEDEIFPRMLEENFMQQQGMLVRTRCYREVGPFDDRLDRGQDYEMNLRLTRRFPGKGLDVASFVYRQHEGPRGRPGAQFAPTERGRGWIKNNRELLRHLRGELELAEYLPRGLGTEELDESRRRRALLQRACVMARCGLWEEALADLVDALVETTPGAPLGRAELDMCRRALGKYIQRHVAIDGLVEDRRLASRFKRVVDDARNDDVQRIFASELARYAWAGLRRGMPVRAARALALARQIAGMRSWIPD